VIMNRRTIARGKFLDPRLIELAEPVHEIAGEVEVSISPLPGTRDHDVFDVIAAFAPGSRSKANIDRLIREEGRSWDKR
jgi:hypothetical protein